MSVAANGADRLASRLREQPFGTVPDLLAAHARERATAVALVVGPRRLTYATLDRLVDRAAAGFQNRGLHAGEVVALLGLKPVEHLALHLGALRAGLAVAPLPDWAPRDDLTRMLEEAGAKLLLTDPSGAGRLAPIASALEYDILSESEDGPLNTWSLIGRPHPVESAPEQIADITFTPGPAPVRHGTRWRQAVRQRPPGLNPVALITAPLHCSQTIAHVLTGLAFAARIVVLQRPDPARFLAVAQGERATHIVLSLEQHRSLGSAVVGEAGCEIRLVIEAGCERPREAVGERKTR